MPKIAFKHHDGLVDMSVDGNHAMTLIDGWDTKEGKEAIRRMSDELAKEINKQVVRDMLGEEDKPHYDDLATQLRFRRKT